MPPEQMCTVRDLPYHRRGRGLTQADLAVLLGVTQQAVAKWEHAGAVPRHRLATIAKHLGVHPDVLVPDGDRSTDGSPPNVRAVVDEFFADQVVISFEGATFHYMPSGEDGRKFWLALQQGPFAHLSAGPVQVLINVDAMRRVDFSEDPPLSSYEPPPAELGASLSEPEDGEDADDEDSTWVERGEARVFVRGVQAPYHGPQELFDGFLDRDTISKTELAELHDEFESGRSTALSIFDLFHTLSFYASFGPDARAASEPLSPGHLHVFESEDFDGVRQKTWVHTRDLLVIEVPTRLWEVFMLSARASRERDEARQRKPRGKRTRSTA